MAAHPHAAPHAAPRAEPGAEPAARTRPTLARQRRVAGGIAWIALVAVLLAGIVGLNVAVLRLNLRLDEVSVEQTQLRAENVALLSQISRQANAAKIKARAAERFGLLPTEPTHLVLTPGR